MKSELPHDEPEAVDLDPGVLARRLDAPATVKAVLEQGGRVLLRSRAVLDPGDQVRAAPGRVRGVAEQIPRFLRNLAEGTEDEALDRADRREPQLERSVRRASEDLPIDRA